MRHSTAQLAALFTSNLMPKKSSNLLKLIFKNPIILYILQKK